MKQYSYLYENRGMIKLIKYDKLDMMHKILNGLCPDNLQDKFTKCFRSQAIQLEVARICIYTQGRREGGAEGAVCPRASGSKGPHQLISKFLS